MIWWMAKLDKDSGIFKLLFKIPKATCWVRLWKPLFIKTSVTPMENSNESNFFSEEGDRSREMWDGVSGSFYFFFKIAESGSLYTYPSSSFSRSLSCTTGANEVIVQNSLKFWSPPGSGFVHVFVSLIQATLVANTTNNMGRRMCRTSVPNKAGPSWDVGLCRGKVTFLTWCSLSPFQINVKGCFSRTCWCYFRKCFSKMVLLT